MESLSGHLLVASGRLNDPNFSRSVVLLVEHDQGGALGLVLNRRRAESLGTIWDGEAHGPCPSDVVVMNGGPLEGPLLALHADPALTERDVVEGVFLSMRRDRVVTLVRESRSPLLVFAGYSGWGAGQLEAEIAGGDWGILPATADLVFGDRHDLWRRATTLVADATLAAALRIKHRPVEPWHN